MICSIVHEIVPDELMCSLTTETQHIITQSIPYNNPKMTKFPPKIFSTTGYPYLLDVRCVHANATMLTTARSSDFGEQSRASFDEYIVKVKYAVRTPVITFARR